MNNVILIEKNLLLRPCDVSSVSKKFLVALDLFYISRSQ